MVITENSNADLVEVNQFKGFGKWDIVVPIYENNNKLTKLLLYNSNGNACICLFHGKSVNNTAFIFYFSFFCLVFFFYFFYLILLFIYI